MIDNIVYKCLASGLDLGHCGDEGEPCFQEQACRERVAAMTASPGPAVTPPCPSCAVARRVNGSA